MSPPSDVLAGLRDALHEASARILASADARTNETCGASIAQERARVLLLTDFAIRVAVPQLARFLRVPSSRRSCAGSPRSRTRPAPSPRTRRSLPWMRRASARPLALVVRSSDVLEAALWADGAVAVQAQQSHPFAARVDAEVRARAFSAPLDIPYFEKLGNVVGDLLAAALAHAPSLDGPIRWAQ